MLGLSPAGTGLILFVAIVAGTAIVIDIVATIKAVRIARIDAETARLRHEHDPEVPE